MSKHKKRFNPPTTVQKNQNPQESLAKFVITAQQFSGPLPPPEILRRYNETVPGCAERIIAMAERQGAHRQGLESKVINSNIINERMGMLLGFALCVAALSAGTYLILQGKDATGIAAIIIALASPAAVFIYGKRKQAKDLQVRQQSIIEAAQSTRNR